MATAKLTGKARQVSRLLVALVVAAILLLGYWAYGAPLVKTAEAGVAYGAKGACSCRFLAGRDLSSCKSDFLDGMGMVMLSEDEADMSVTARVPLVASDTATYREGYGCVLESQAD